MPFSHSNIYTVMLGFPASKSAEVEECPNPYDDDTKR